jgi:hypothetical protein
VPTVDITPNTAALSFSTSGKMKLWVYITPTPAVMDFLTKCALGTTTQIIDTINTTLYELGLPFVEPGKIRVVVQATKNGVEEHDRDEVVVEFNNDGTLVGDRPNKANVEKLDISSGLTLAVAASVVEDDADAPAISIKLYIQPFGTPLDFDSPAATANLPVSVLNYHGVSLTYTPVSSGWYTFTVRACSGRTPNISSFLIPDYSLITGTGAILSYTIGAVTHGPYTWIAGTDFSPGSSNDEAATNLAAAINTTLAGSGLVATTDGNKVLVSPGASTLSINTTTTAIVPGSESGHDILSAVYDVMDVYLSTAAPGAVVELDANVSRGD